MAGVSITDQGSKAILNSYKLPSSNFLNERFYNLIPDINMYVNYHYRTKREIQNSIEDPNIDTLIFLPKP